MRIEYYNFCPVCNGSLGLKEIKENFCEKKRRSLYEEGEEIRKFRKFFKKGFGSFPRKLQIFWAKRLLRGESFAAVSPPGMGKTSFGCVFSMFLADKRKRSYIVLPTTLLVKQVMGRLEEINEKFKKSVKIACYHSEMKGKEKEWALERIRNGDFQILVTTSQFLSRRFREIQELRFDFIFVDDVDSILKGSKNVENILRLLDFGRKGVLMVSTATAKKGDIRLFRKFLGFDVGLSFSSLRNVVDVIIKEKGIRKLERVLEWIGGGGIIYTRSQEEAEKIWKELKSKYRIGIVISKEKKDYEKFVKGEIDYLVGTAFYYGTLVRGLDLPKRIRFCIFYGSPVFRIRLKDIRELGYKMIKVLALVFRNRPEIKEFLHVLPVIDKPKYQETLEKLKGVLEKLIEKGEKGSDDVIVRKGEIIFPDVRTYIQGSGRTSRLFAWGITLGVSFLMEEDEDMIRGFLKRAGYYDIEFMEWEAVNWERVKEELEKTRKLMCKKSEEPVNPVLFIVESPTKAKHISHFFGKPSVRVMNINGKPGLVVYEILTSRYVLLVTACLGHVTDLITGIGFHGVKIHGKELIPVYTSIKRCGKCGYQFTEEVEECRKCGSREIDDSRNRIIGLRRLAEETGFVVIGTDPDTEGEKIAWDLQNLLKPYAEVRRAEFHEVTRKAVVRALENLRVINENLVKAQMVRRIEDRWIGFQLSQKLWRIFEEKNLSAGRAQTPVLGWIIEREREHKRKKRIAWIPELGIKIENFPMDWKGRVKAIIQRVEERKREVKPLPPYTTDTLLKDANRILKISAKECMKIAQNLFEAGLITYHRTDSVHVSEAGLRIAEEYLDEEFVPRRWAEKGTHECIRPTRGIEAEDLERLVQEGIIFGEGIGRKELMVYDLIFRRFMASQAREYEIISRIYRVRIKEWVWEIERVIRAKGRAWEIYKWGLKVEGELEEGVVEVWMETKWVPKLPLFSQSDVIGLMKERGIGRPSTYASIMEKLFLRKYIVERMGKIISTIKGKKVYYYLSKNYGLLVSEERTRLLEEKMASVESGEVEYKNVLWELYQEVKKI
ncbi:MAG: reverse gyrase [Candidatus Aenigmatarchaeota archaeon]|nr:MAG: reverse gyrase [Candidatus Aenigmarchaeota archaeon]